MGRKVPIQDVTDEQISRYIDGGLFSVIKCRRPTPGRLSNHLRSDSSKGGQDPRHWLYQKRCATIKTVHPDQFEILESTTYPGTTGEVAVPLLEVIELVAGSDLGVAYYSQ